MRSLAFKWIATLLLTSLVGVVLVGIFAYRTTVNEFDRLRVEQAKAAFVSDATTYYQTYHTWEGLGSWLRDQTPVALQNHDGNLPLQLFALVDGNNRVVLSSGPFRLGEDILVSDLRDVTPVVVAGRQVGAVLVAVPPPGLDPRQQDYLNRTMTALLIGAVGASAVALLIGVILSRQFLYPLSELTKAIAAMKHGDLNQRVQVRTRDELGQLAETFNQMSAEIHRANQLRQQMTADIAHDLRTPLMVISGYLEALHDGTLPPTPERFEAMNNEALLLKRLVDDLRTLSLADAGELKLATQPVQPRDLLEQVRQSFEPLAHERHILLSVEADADLPDLIIDRERMVQVLGNLVTNAIRYTPTNGSVTLGARRAANGVRLNVSDTGSGIEQDKLPYIFERFYRTEAARSQNEGESGLGLAIAKSIVEAHGGQIAAESRVGKGTSILITLHPAAVH
jgi:signal transduction histidine kinase